MEKKKNSLTTNDNKKILWILERIDNKEAFLKSIFDSFIVAVETENFGQFRDNLEDWLASAEIDSIPGAKKRILETHKAYMKDKNISRGWDNFTKKIGLAQPK
jgi:hypothetical protein